MVSQPLGYNASEQIGRRLLDAADLQDELCAPLADCSSCTQVTQSPHQGQLEPVSCQWVIGASGPSCVGRPSGTGTSELSTWLSRHERLAISESEFGPPRPKCRLIVREASKCLIASSPSSQLAQRCDAVSRSSPRCHTCGYLLPECGFCGETSVNAAAATGSTVATRCVARFEADTTPCTVACNSQEEVFGIPTASNGGMVLRGLVAFPLWREYGMQYAADQYCTWLLGEPSLGLVTSVLQQALERYDAIHISDAGQLAAGELPMIFGRESTARVELQLAAPLRLQFFSDNTREASGFVFSWDQTPGSNESARSPSPSSGSSSSGLTGFGVSKNGFLQQNLVYILIGGIGVLFAVLIGCVCFLYSQRLTFWLGAGSNVPTVSTPQSRREERERHRQLEQEERRQKAYEENLQRRSEARAAVGDASDEPSQSQSRAGASYRGKPPKAKAATPVRQQASTNSASSGKSGGKQPATPKAPAAPPPPPPPKPPKSPKSAKSPKKSKTEQKPPEPPEAPGDAASSAVAIHTAAIHQEMMQAMNAPGSERKAILRELQRKWHPDKNKEDDKEVATAVFQYINANSQWFLTNTEP